MKKFTIVLAVIAILIALIPVVGNKIIEDTLSDKLNQLSLNGVEALKSHSIDGYFSKKKSYEFLVKDAQKFALYLNGDLNASNSYSAEMLDGVVLGVDLEYSNYPFGNDILLDIYPLSLSKNIMSAIEKEESGFYDYFKKLLENRAILLHIDYRVSNDTFNGYLKDFKEKYTLKDNIEVSLELSGVTYEGRGFFIEQDSLDVNAKKVSLKVSREDEKFKLEFDNILTTSIFESDTTYAHSTKLEKLEYLIKTDKSYNIGIKASDLYGDVSSNTQGERADFFTKASLKDFVIETNSTTLTGVDFNYDISLENADKDSYKNINVLLAQVRVRYTDKLYFEIEKNVMQLFSKGLIFKIADFSLDEISSAKSEPIRGFEIKANVEVTEESNMSKDVKTFLTLLPKNISIDSTLKFSNDIYEIINDSFPAAAFATPYAKVKDDDLVFEIKFINEKLIVNTKPLN